jgi:glycosyltransferase involved in cell wall biosynthesis
MIESLSSNSKSIAIFTHFLISGGAEKQSAILAKAFGEDYKIFFILFNDKVEPRNLDIIKNEENVSLIILKGNKLSKIYQLYKILTNKRITCLFTFLTFPNFIGGLVGKIAKVKFIISNIRTSYLPFWKILLEKYTHKKFAILTIFNNYSGLRFLIDKGFSPAKCIVIPNCLEKLSPPLVRPENTIISILSVGRFVIEKDFKTSLLVINELKKRRGNFIYYIIGFGALEERIKAIINEYDLKDYVSLVNKPDNIEYYYEISDMYLSTSIFEGTSNSILEAMSFSLPIIATNVGDNKEYIRHGENGFLHEIKDYLSISHSLEMLMNDQLLRVKFGLASHEIIKKNYSYNKFRLSYYNLIESILIGEQNRNQIF